MNKWGLKFLRQRQNQFLLEQRFPEQSGCLIKKKKFPKSFEIIKDKAKFDNFVKEHKSIIDSEKINVRGIEIH